MKTKRGLYRFNFSGVGECARTHAMSGDASPFLEREIYEALSFQPAFDDLPTRAEYIASERSRRYPIRECDVIWAETA